jgi:hypothetical protein
LEFIPLAIGYFIASSSVCTPNYATYMAAIDYLVAPHDLYSSSTTDGNGFSRDSFGCIVAIYSTLF